MSETSFGRYRLLKLLGEGGMGQVYRAFDTETDRIVALKVLPPELVKNREFAQRFRREAKTAAALSDPHIVPIHHYGEIDGRLYVDMRLIEGDDLARLISRTSSGFDAAKAVTYVEQLAEALHSAHRVGLVHRDVKPSNVLVTERDFIYLIDFGIALGPSETRLTQSGLAIGTFAYMAPERMSAGRVDSRSDVYSLACVLYECLTGTPPFTASTVEQYVAAHLMTDPPRPSSLRKSVSPSFDDVIAKGMAKDPAVRFGSTIELASAAREALEHAKGPSSSIKASPDRLISSNPTKAPDAKTPAQPSFHAAETQERKPVRRSAPRRTVTNDAATQRKDSRSNPREQQQDAHRTKSTVARTIVIASIAGAALVAGAVLAAVTIFGKSTIVAEGAAQSVIDLVVKQTGFEPKDVTCPEGVEAEVGTKFECTFTGPEGTEYTADMRITKVDGRDVEFYIETRPS